jgi:hypothetical protein
MMTQGRTDRQIDTLGNRKVERQEDGQKVKWTDEHTKKERAKQEDRSSDRQAGRLPDKQTGIQTER